MSQQQCRYTTLGYPAATNHYILRTHVDKRLRSRNHILIRRNTYTQYLLCLNLPEHQQRCHRNQAAPDSIDRFVIDKLHVVRSHNARSNDNPAYTRNALGNHTHSLRSTYQPHLYRPGMTFSYNTL